MPEISPEIRTIKGRPKSEKRLFIQEFYLQKML